jgi:hypothetical protein
VVQDFPNDGDDPYERRNRMPLWLELLLIVVGVVGVIYYFFRKRA